jgi:hypothetical protein
MLKANIKYEGITGTALPTYLKPKKKNVYRYREYGKFQKDIQAIFH